MPTNTYSRARSRATQDEAYVDVDVNRESQYRPSIIRWCPCESV